MKKFTRLNEEERNEIVVLLNKGIGVNEIARRLGRDKGAISREINKNHGRKMYRANLAQKRAEIKQQESHKKTVLKSHALRIEVERQLKLHWSPELIAGRLKRDKIFPTVCPESIYSWIFNERPDLINYLTRYSQDGKHYKRGRKPKRAEKIKGRIDITQRPESINNRQDFGHWETDLMEGQGQSCLKVSVERKIRFTKMQKVQNKTSEESNKALVNMLGKMPQGSVKSITYDNGSENSGHMKLNHILGTDSYFCQPYHSWEKGTVENTNGIIRRFLPKETNFDNISDTQIQQIEFWLNNRPRKCLNFLTPQEVFNSTVALAT
jgi:IS30 family transposase